LGAPRFDRQELLAGLEFVARLELLLRVAQQLARDLDLLPVEAGDERVELLVGARDVLPDRPRDDERRARLVDQDRVHLVDDRVEVCRCTRWSRLCTMLSRR
jgi:hypothetical protein